MLRTSRSLVASLAVSAAVTACTQVPAVPPAPTQAGLPNPASVHCEQQGGRVVMRDDGTGGQVGICVFSDGSECEEWAFLRQECEPGGIATPASDTEPAPTPPEGWEVFTHPSLGYSFFYPEEGTFESSEPERYTLVVGPLENDEHWPWFNISHPDEADYHPPADVDLQAWLAGQSRLPGKVVGTRTIGGESAVHTRFDDPRGPPAYSDDRFFFVHNGQLYEITILHTGKEDWTVYDRFLDSFHF